jgi:hypothetical protein
MFELFDSIEEFDCGDEEEEEVDEFGDSGIRNNELEKLSFMLP